MRLKVKDDLAFSNLFVPCCAPVAATFSRRYNREVRAPGSLLIAIPICIALAGCGSRDGDWIELRHPAGFKLRHPPHWTVETGDGGQVVVRDAPNGRFALVQPFFLRNRTKALNWLEQCPSRLASTFPGSRLGRIVQLGQQPDEAEVALTFAQEGARWRANLLCSIWGKSGMLFAIAAPEREFKAASAALVDTLRTFQYADPLQPAVVSPVSLEFVAFQDPREAAFWMDVPEGWRTTGGMYRFAPTDARPSVSVESPDGTVRITAGDPQLPLFIVPSPVLAASGYAEGSWYSPSQGVNLQVRRYPAGVEFAAEYVRRKCPDLRWVERRDRPDLDSRLVAILGGADTHLTTGEVAFTCPAGEKVLLGYYFAGTLRTRAFGAAVWNVQYLHGYLATEDALDLAEAALARMTLSGRLNPQWAAIQKHLPAHAPEIVAQANAEIARTLNETYWRRQRVREYLSRQWSNTMLGAAETTDPETLEVWKASTGHNYYWHKPGAGGWERPDTNLRALGTYR